MAKRDDAVAAKRPAPQWTIFWPAFRVSKQSLDEALGHPAVVRQLIGGGRRHAKLLPRVSFGNRLAMRYLKLEGTLPNFRNDTVAHLT